MCLSLQFFLINFFIFLLIFPKKGKMEGNRSKEYEFGSPDRIGEARAGSGGAGEEAAEAVVPGGPV